MSDLVFGITTRLPASAPEQDALADRGTFFERLLHLPMGPGYIYAAYAFGDEAEGISVSIAAAADGFKVVAEACHAGLTRDVWHGVANDLRWQDGGSRRFRTYPEARQEAFDFIYNARDWLGSPLAARPVLQSVWDRIPRAYRGTDPARPRALFLTWDHGTESGPVRIVLDARPVHGVTTVQCPRCEKWKIPPLNAAAAITVCPRCQYEFILSRAG